MQRDRHFTDYEPVTPAARRKPQRDEENSSLAPVAISKEEEWFHPAQPSLDEDKLEKRARETADEPVFPELLASHKAEKSGSWILKRGHALSYVGLFLFTFVLYFRPYELFDSLSGFTSIAFWIALFTLAIFIPSQLAVEGTLTFRPREVNLVLLLCVTGLLSIPLAIDPGEAWGEFNSSFIKAVLMFIVMVNVVRTEKRLKGLLFLALGIGCALSVSAMSDYRAGRLLSNGQRVYGLVGGMFGNPNDLALHLVTMIPIACALFFTTRRLLMKLIYAGCAVLMIVGNIPTFSRGGFIGLVCVVLVLAWKIGRKHRMAVVTLIFAGLVAFIVLAPGSYMDRLASIYDFKRDETGSAASRRDILLRSLLVSARHPVLGIGMGNFHIVSIQNLVSHNAYTQVSAEMGLTALVIYVMFMVTPLKRLRQIERETFSSRHGSRFYYLAIGFQASIIGYMVTSFFASVAYLFYIYYLVGYAICLRRMYEARKGVEEASRAEINNSSSDQVELVPAALAR